MKKLSLQPFQDENLRMRRRIMNGRRRRLSELTNQRRMKGGNLK
jgi:hypothetical protein